MAFIMQHGEKVVTAIVVALCGYWIFQNLDVEKPQDLDDLKSSTARIKSFLAKPPGPEFRWSEKNRVPYGERSAANFNRPREGEGSSLAAYTFYPRPMAPYVDPASKPVHSDKPIVDDFAILKPPSEFSVTADHYGVYITGRIPPEVAQKYMVPVRMEIYRGEQADKIDQLVQTKELNPEAPIAGIQDNLTPGGASGAVKGPAPDPAKGPAKPVAPEASGPSEFTSRSGETPADEAAPKEKDVPVDAKSLELPEHLKNALITHDRTVSPKTTYFYKARLVARLIDSGPGHVITVGGNRIRVKLPKEVEKVAPKSPDAKVELYASAFTDPIKIATPPSFMLRFAGKQGDLPDPNLPPARRPAPSYKGQFALKVWVYPASKWEEVTVWPAVGEELSALIPYEKAETKERDKWEFKAGFKLAEIKAGEERKMIVVKEAAMEEKMGPDGETPIRVPKLDADGRPIMVERQVERNIPTLIAVLEDVKTGDLEEHPLRADFEKRKEAFVVLDRMLRDQEEREKELKEKIKKALESKKGGG
ncbi:MAG: hypothetical protein M5U26_15605 [Planctomycetota bacterium]|nr:hypothetical protein [Planctomycetota bacterium]